MSINRDVIIAICLLVICGILMVASFDIREPDYGQLSPAAWPRTLVVLLAILSLIYLVQSLRKASSQISDGIDDSNPDARKRDSSDPSPSITEPLKFIAYWRNVFWCFALFFAYLLSMPWLGMLIGGSLFVFLLLNCLGGWSPRALLVHAAIALVVIGGMWSLFTFGLGVLLPTNAWFGRF